jgi:hypothetical protein
VFRFGLYFTSKPLGHLERDRSRSGRGRLKGGSGALRGRSEPRLAGRPAGGALSAETAEECLWSRRWRSAGRVGVTQAGLGSAAVQRSAAGGECGCRRQRAASSSPPASVGHLRGWWVGRRVDAHQDGPIQQFAPRSAAPLRGRRPRGRRGDMIATPPDRDRRCSCASAGRGSR